MILMDQTHAIMSRHDFKSLRNYSCSYPTGTTAGKIWKRAKNFYRQTNDPADWILGEFGPPSGDGTVPIYWREILVVE